MAAPLGGMGAPHRPVLLQETLKFLAPERGGLFVDCTVGLGGHSEAILEASAETRVIGIDRDAAALAYARSDWRSLVNAFRAVHANFRELGRMLSELRMKAIRPASWLIWVFRHCSLIRRSEVLVFVLMRHSTCGWIRRRRGNRGRSSAATSGRGNCQNHL